MRRFLLAAALLLLAGDTHAQVFGGPGGGYPPGAVPVAASNTGSAASAAATLASATGKFTYICGFHVASAATAEGVGLDTIAGVIGGTMSFGQTTQATTTGVGITSQTFTPCIPSSASGTAIVVTSMNPGAGGTVTANAWGYQR